MRIRSLFVTPVISLAVLPFLQTIQFLPASTLSNFSAMPVVQTFDFKAQPKKGDSATFTQNVHFTLSGADVIVKGKEVQTVKESHQDGSMVIVAEDTDQTATVNGAASPNIPDQTETTTSDPIGRPILITGTTPTPAGAYRLGALAAFLRPNKPVKIGDTWTIDTDGTKTKAGVSNSATYTLEAETKVGIYDTLKVSFSIKETDGDEKATSEGTMWICKDSGWTAKVIAKMKNIQIPGSPGAADASIELERIK